jgi:hypothetical protein
MIGSHPFRFGRSVALRCRRYLSPHARLRFGLSALRWLTPHGETMAPLRWRGEIGPPIIAVGARQTDNEEYVAHVTLNRWPVAGSLVAV